MVVSDLVAALRAQPGFQPLSGRFEHEGEDTLFLPRFAFVDDLRYSLLIGGVEVATIHRERRSTPPSARALEIYPTATQIPVNLLKLYVAFSQPMSEGYALRAVRFERADTGAQLEGVLLQMEPELWDGERRRLTLLLEPGRIKRGLAPNLEAGYPLVEGVPVCVIVGVRFRDAGGRPLVAELRRRYDVGPPLRTRVDPAVWTISQPQAGSAERLTVEFDRPLDHALLAHCLQVHDPADAAVAGDWSTSPAERS